MSSIFYGIASDGELERRKLLQELTEGLFRERVEKAVEDYMHPEENLWRCTCGGNHFVSVVAPDPSDEYGWVSIEDMQPCFDSIWKRMRGAFQVLRGKPHYWAEIQCDYKKARQIAAALIKATENLKHD